MDSRIIRNLENYQTINNKTLYVDFDYSNLLDRRPKTYAKERQRVDGWVELTPLSYLGISGDH